MPPVRLGQRTWCLDDPFGAPEREAVRLNQTSLRILILLPEPFVRIRRLFAF